MQLFKKHILWFFIKIFFIRVLLQKTNTNRGRSWPGCFWLDKNISMSSLANYPHILLECNLNIILYLTLMIYTFNHVYHAFTFVKVRGSWWFPLYKWGALATPFWQDSNREKNTKSYLKWDTTRRKIQQEIGQKMHTHLTHGCNQNRTIPVFWLLPMQ